MIAKKVGELTSKARFALQEGREDLAEGALKRQVDLEEQGAKLDQVQHLAREEEAKLEDSLSALRARKTQMEEALAAFAIAKSDALMGGDGGFANARDVERKVDNAEAAFDRGPTHEDRHRPGDEQPAARLTLGKRQQPVCDGHRSAHHQQCPDAAAV